MLLTEAAQSQLRIEQQQEAAAFKLQQTVDNFELKNTQLDAKDRLTVQQMADKGKFERIQQMFAEKSQSPSRYEATGR